MISIILTLSSGVQTFLIPSPIEDTIHLHYGSCAYCSTDMRMETIETYPVRRFCQPKERTLYHKHHIDDTLTPMTQMRQPVR